MKNVCGELQLNRSPHCSYEALENWCFHYKITILTDIH